MMGIILLPLPLNISKYQSAACLHMLTLEAHVSVQRLGLNK